MNYNALTFKEWLIMVATGFGWNQAAVQRLIPASTTSQTSVATKKETSRVVRVMDGDTYDVLASGASYWVRLLDLNATEPDQPIGQPAADSVARLLKLKQRVLVTRRGGTCTSGS
jgi:endonuclease YncB( thermonuclease family)